MAGDSEGCKQAYLCEGGAIGHREAVSAARKDSRCG